MKVLICIPCLLTGGTEVQTLNLVHALCKGGHEVVTMCYFEFTPEMVDRYESAGSKVILLSVNGTRTSGLIPTIKFLCKGMKSVIMDFNPDVAHVQYMAPGLIPILILRYLGIQKIVATTHTPADIYPNLRLLKFVVKHTLVAFQCITLRAEKSYFGDSHLFSKNDQLKKKGNHFTIYNALPYGMTISPECLNHKASVIGVVSRLEPIKGMDLVIPAFAEILKKHPEIKLIIVGDGSLRKMMERQSKELNVEKAIHWTGKQPQEKLCEWYGRMDIVLMPSRSEGFGLTAIEAMANGCVVVASNAGGLPEVIEDEKAGMIHNVEDVDDMSAKILRLLDDEDFYNYLRENAKLYVNRFSFKKFSTLINCLYSKL